MRSAARRKRGRTARRQPRANSAMNSGVDASEQESNPVSETASTADPLELRHSSKEAPPEDLIPSSSADQGRRESPSVASAAAELSSLSVGGGGSKSKVSDDDDEEDELIMPTGDNASFLAQARHYIANSKESDRAARAEERKSRRNRMKAKKQESSSSSGGTTRESATRSRRRHQPKAVITPSEESSDEEARKRERHNRRRQAGLGPKPSWESLPKHPAHQFPYARRVHSSSAYGSEDGEGSYYSYWRDLSSCWFSSWGTAATMCSRGVEEIPHVVNTVYNMLPEREQLAEYMPDVSMPGTHTMRDSTRDDYY